MKNYLKRNNKLFFRNFVKKSIFFKYSLKYKVMVRRINYILRNRKVFGLKRFFLGVLFFLVLSIRKSFSVYNSFFRRKFFMKCFSLNRRSMLLKERFSKKLFLLIKKVSLRSSISKHFIFLFPKNNCFLYSYKKQLFFIRRGFFSMYFFFDFFSFYVMTFSLGFFKGYFDKFVEYVKCNYSLLNNSFFDYTNAILSDNKSFLSLNPVILNNIISF